jgi:quercetin dioxygenase-like cupin family protein
MTPSLEIIMNARPLLASVVIAGLTCGVAQSSSDTQVKELFVKQLADFPGKEAVMLQVSYPPGGKDEIHRHDAHAFVYVLEGTIRMQLKGQPEQTLKQGEVYYEGPNDIHLVGRNASATEPAKFVVVLIKNQGAPVVMPVKQ